MVRVIARLDIKGSNLVKGIHLEGLRVLGKPEHFAQHYYETDADELIYMDVVASLYGRSSLLDIIRKTADRIFIPLTVGGGIRTIEDIKSILRAGADKVAINTAALNNPSFINEAVKKFGSSTIVISIEAIRQSDGRYLAYTDNGQEYTGKDVFQWAREVFEREAGEILITSVDREGTGQGYEIELIRKISQSVSIPVIACGGAGSPADVAEAILKGKADAVSMASILHYDFIRFQKIHADYSAEGNTEFLTKNATFSKIQPANIPQIKEFLSKQGIACRCLNEVKPAEV